MSWHLVGGRRYYYRHARVGGQPRRIYAGTGPAAEMAAVADALRRAERRAKREARRGEQARWQSALGCLLELCDRIRLLVRATLLPAGFYQHGKSSWRKKRHARDHNNSSTI
jgi:hypothetical protein